MLTGGSTVSPLAGLPMLALVVLWLPWRVRRESSLPSPMTALAAFVVAALASSALAHFLPIPPRFGETLLSREIRAIFTLAMGLGFYLVACLLPRTPGQARASLRWLYLGAGLLLVYSLYQAVRLRGLDFPVPSDYLAFHRLFSIRDPFRDRVTGLAYEPSWLGNQLVVLYLPLWISSVIAGYSVFPSLRRRFSLEALLLVPGLVVLFLSFARSAWLSLLLLLGWWFVSSAGELSERIARKRLPPARQAWSKRMWIARLLGWVVAGAAMVLAGILLVAIGSFFNERVAVALKLNLRSILASYEPLPYVFANRLRYAERLMYWIGGFRVFTLYPVFGVGLGNAGFLMPDTIPAFGTLLPEILNTVLQGLSGVPNTKSLWVRLLAETGIVGFSCFVAWMGLSLAAAHNLARRSSPLGRALGLAGILALVAQVSEGFSLDTFALPQLWLVLGLMTAMARTSEAG